MSGYRVDQTRIDEFIARDLRELIGEPSGTRTQDPLITSDDLTGCMDRDEHIRTGTYDVAGNEQDPVAADASRHVGSLPPGRSRKSLKFETGRREARE